MRLQQARIKVSLGGLALAVLIAIGAMATSARAQTTQPADSGATDTAATEPGNQLRAVSDELDQLIRQLEQAEPGRRAQLVEAMRQALDKAATADRRADAARTRAMAALERAMTRLAEARQKAKTKAGAEETEPANTQATAARANDDTAGGTSDADASSSGGDRSFPGVTAALGMDWPQLVWVAAAAVAGLVLLQTLVATGGLVKRAFQHGRQRERQHELFRAQLAALTKAQREAEARQLHWSGLRRFEVRAKRQEDEAGLIRSFELVPHDGKPIPSYYPGQFLTFQFKVPGQDKPVVRCYSLSDAPRNDHYRISVKRLDAPPDQPDAPPGLASNFLHDQIAEGETLEVRAPSGEFYLDPTADESPVVLIAGGVGITPLLAMLNGIVEAGARRETWLFYATRHGGEQIMKSHLEAIARDYPNIHVRLCCSHPRDEDQQGRDYHHAGRIDLDVLKRELPSNNYSFYLCGPPGMIDSMVSALEQWGVPERDIHLERFGPSASKKKAKPVSSEATGPQVTFRRSGVTANWDPNAEHLWEFAQANEVPIDSGCLQGRCGTCETAVLSGKVKYTTEPTYDYEEGSCLTCCAVPDGPVELDA